MASAEAIADPEVQLLEHCGGGRFNKMILWIFGAALVIGPTAVVIGIHSFASAKTQQGDAVAAQSDPAVTVHQPTSLYAVMAGNVIPAVLISGINWDLPGPILAQVSQNVFDNATDKYLLISQSRKAAASSGPTKNASAHRQQRVQITWQRLPFTNTSSMNLVADAGHRSERLRGLLGSDQRPLPRRSDGGADDGLQREWKLRRLSLLPAQPGGDGRRDGCLCSLRPIRWTRSTDHLQWSESSATIEIRPGCQINVRVTQDLVFAGPYGK